MYLKKQYILLCRQAHIFTYIYGEAKNTHYVYACIKHFYLSYHASSNPTLFSMNKTKQADDMGSAFIRNRQASLIPTPPCFTFTFTAVAQTFFPISSKSADLGTKATSRLPLPLTFLQVMQCFSSFKIKQKWLYKRSKTKMESS